MTSPFAATWTRRLDPQGRTAHKVYASLHTDVRTCTPCADAERSMHDESVDAMRETWLADLAAASDEVGPADVWEVENA